MGNDGEHIGRVMDGEGVAVGPVGPRPFGTGTSCDEAGGGAGGVISWEFRLDVPLRPRVLARRRVSSWSVADMNSAASN